jgi:hypothetical protein
LIKSGNYIDKTDIIHAFFTAEELFDEEIQDFKKRALLLVYCRRFGKSTFLGFLDAVFNALPYLGNCPSDLVRARIWTYNKGPELLAFGLHPVVHLEMTQVHSIETLCAVVRLALLCAGLNPDEVDKLTPTSGGSASVLLEAGIRALNAQYLTDTGAVSETILLVDEYDFVHRHPDYQQPLRDAVVELYNLSKNKDSGISLMILTGLTRMVGAGISTLNGLVDVGFITRYHGLCGILRSEFLHSCPETLKSMVRSQHGEELEAVLDALSKEWNGFRFGITQSPDETIPVENLYSPIDILQLVAHILHAFSLPSSEWIQKIHAEFEFTRIRDKFNGAGQFELLVTHLAGGWVTQQSLRDPLDRNCYMTLASSAVPRILYELGLLSVDRAETDRVLLKPPNSAVMRRGLEALMRQANFTKTPTASQIDAIIDSGAIDLIAEACHVTAMLYKDSSWMREYAFQDMLYLALLKQLPPVPGATYSVVAEYSVRKGRVDIAIAFGLKLLLIEIKLSKEPADFKPSVVMLVRITFIIFLLLFSLLLIVILSLRRRSTRISWKRHQFKCASTYPHPHTSPPT